MKGLQESMCEVPPGQERVLGWTADDTISSCHANSSQLFLLRGVASIQLQRYCHLHVEEAQYLDELMLSKESHTAQPIHAYRREDCRG